MDDSGYAVICELGRGDTRQQHSAGHGQHDTSFSTITAVTTTPAPHQHQHHRRLPTLSSHTAQLTVGLVSGMMVNICVHELLPTAFKYEGRTHATLRALSPKTLLNDPPHQTPPLQIRPYGQGHDPQVSCQHDQDLKRNGRGRDQAQRTISAKFVILTQIALISVSPPVS